MASFPNLTDIVSTTIQSRSGKLADNVLKQNALLARLQQKGNVKPFSGGNVILQEIMYNDASTQNAGSYSGYDVIDITPNSPITSAQFDIKQYAAAVSISGLDQLPERRTHRNNYKCAEHFCSNQSRRGCQYRSLSFGCFEQRGYPLFKRFHRAQKPWQQRHHQSGIGQDYNTGRHRVAIG